VGIAAAVVLAKSMVALGASEKRAKKSWVGSCSTSGASFELDASTIQRSLRQPLAYILYSHVKKGSHTSCSGLEAIRNSI
jgi:hypothetical protein